MVDIFRALGDETRLRMLAQIFQEERCVCEFEECLGLTQSNASRHLMTLKRSGILLSRKKAQWTYYRMNPDFVESHKNLYEYLKEELVKSQTYHQDSKKFAEFKQNNRCGC